MKSNRDAGQTPNDLLAELRTLVADAEAMIAGATERSTDAFSALRSRFDAIRLDVHQVVDRIHSQRDRRFAFEHDCAGLICGVTL